MDEKILNDFNLSLSNDAVFKHYYSVASNLSVLVSLILGEEVLPEDITYLSNEVIITPKVKKPRFDLRILIQNELNIDLEMQNNKEKYFKERVVYYFSSMIMNDIQEGESYHSDKNYLGIWLLNSNVSIFDNNSYYEEYVIYGTISKKEIIEDKYKILIIDLKKLNLCDNIVLREYLSMIESNAFSIFTIFGFCPKYASNTTPSSFSFSNSISFLFSKIELSSMKILINLHLFRTPYHQCHRRYQILCSCVSNLHQEKHKEDNQMLSV